MLEKVDTSTICSDEWFNEMFSYAGARGQAEYRNTDVAVKRVLPPLNNDLESDFRHDTFVGTEPMLAVRSLAHDADMQSSRQPQGSG